MSNDEYVAWGPHIVVLEPAPRLTYPARYLAPTFHRMGHNGMFLFIGGLVSLFPLSFAGWVVGSLTDWLIGPWAQKITLPLFFLSLVIIVTGSFILVSRHCLRGDPAEFEELWQLTTAGNVAWRSLPPVHRHAQVERLRAMNAAARLFLVSPDDTAAAATVREHSEALQGQARSILPERPTHADPVATTGMA